MGSVLSILITPCSHQLQQQWVEQHSVPAGHHSLLMILSAGPCALFKGGETNDGRGEARQSGEGPSLGDPDSQGPNVEAGPA